MTVAENNKNCEKRRIYPYISKHKWGGFAAQVKIGDKNIHIGIFETEEEANSHRMMVCEALERLTFCLAKKSKPGRKRNQDKCADADAPDA